MIIDTGADQCTCGGDAWVPLNDTGEKIQCNGYYQGKDAVDGPILPIMSLLTCVETAGEEPILLLIHQACYIKDSNQTESLCMPYQCMDHGVKFDLIPNSQTKEDGTMGK